MKVKLYNTGMRCRLGPERWIKMFYGTKVGRGDRKIFHIILRRKGLKGENRVVKTEINLSVEALQAIFFMYHELLKDNVTHPPEGG